jgi:hypothetical protein
MENVPQNDLLSAYLDGELTAEEESQVERLLAASPEARQLLDELRALSSSLQALPPLAVGEDISEQVLRRAERRMLSEPEKDLSEHDESEGDEEASSPEPRVWRTILRRALRPRNLAWSGVAVAVALLLMVMDRNQPGQSPRRVAMNKAPAEREASRVVSEEPSMRAAPEPADEALAGAAAPTEKPAEALAEESTAEPAKYGSRPRGDLAAEKAGGPVELRERRAPPAEPPPMAAPSTAPLAEKESKAAPPDLASVTA